MTTVEDICTMLDKDLNNAKDALTKVIDGNQDLARQISDASEKIDEIDLSIVNRMNSVRDNLMEVLLEKQTETNLSLKNVRENLEVMAHAGEGGFEGGFEGFPPVGGVPSLSGKSSLMAPGFKSRASMGGASRSSKGGSANEGGGGGGGGGPDSPRRHVHMDKGGSGQYNIVDNKDSVGSYRRPNMDGVLLKGSTMQQKLTPQQEEANKHSAKLQGSQSQPLLPSQQGQGQGQGQPSNSQVKVVKDKAERIHGAEAAGQNPSLNHHPQEHHYLLNAQAQFVAELCINFEDISVKKKRVTNIPPVLCQSIASVTQVRFCKYHCAHLRGSLFMYILFDCFFHSMG